MRGRSAAAPRPRQGGGASAYRLMAFGSVSHRDYGDGHAEQPAATGHPLAAAKGVMGPTADSGKGRAREAQGADCGGTATFPLPASTTVRRPSGVASGTETMSAHAGWNLPRGLSAVTLNSTSVGVSRTATRGSLLQIGSWSSSRVACEPPGACTIPAGTVSLPEPLRGEHPASPNQLTRRTAACALNSNGTVRRDDCRGPHGHTFHRGVSARRCAP